MNKSKLNELRLSQIKQMWSYIDNCVSDDVLATTQNSVIAGAGLMAQFCVEQELA